VRTSARPRSPKGLGLVDRIIFERAGIQAVVGGQNDHEDGAGSIEDGETLALLSAIQNRTMPGMVNQRSSCDYERSANTHAKSSWTVVPVGPV
jgi:hypothetical protein